MAMGGDSCYEGRGIESQHHILDGHIFTFICCGNCNVCLNDENKGKRGPGWPIKNKQCFKLLFYVFLKPIFLYNKRLILQ